MTVMTSQKEKQCPLCKNGTISQFDGDFSKDVLLPLEERALIIMVKILDNLEEFKELSTNLQSIMAYDEILETRLLSMFKTLVNGIELEYKQLDHIV
jgi:hypothetical protein